jgi:hypothetical protein
MKKVLILILFFILSACGDPLGYRNIEIKNLASPNIKIEGMELKYVNGKGEFFSVPYKGNPSTFIGISQYGIVTPSTGREMKPKFQKISNIKIYYKSKSCLLFYLDEGKSEVFNKYTNSFLPNKILVLTNNGLEFLTKEEYEANKGKYTINDSNVRCLKDEK